jgi:hypothetical protein
VGEEKLKEDATVVGGGVGGRVLMVEAFFVRRPKSSGVGTCLVGVGVLERSAGP